MLKVLNTTCSQLYVEAKMLISNEKRIDSSYQSLGRVWRSEGGWLVGSALQPDRRNNF
jgi:hypothetical protein